MLLGTFLLRREICADPCLVDKADAIGQIALEDLLGEPVSKAALPFGAYDAACLRAVKRSGYTTVYSSDPGMTGSAAWFRRRWSYRRDIDFDVSRLARRSRSPSACLAIARFMCSGKSTCLTSTSATFTPHGSVC